MESLQLNHLTSVYDFMLTTTRSLAINLDRTADHDTPITLHIHFYKPFSSQTWEDGRPEITKLVLLIRTTSWTLDYLKSIYRFIFNSKGSLITKIGRILDHSTITLPIS